MISQSRAIQCSVVNPECSVTCNPREATRTEDIPLCCTGMCIGNYRLRGQFVKPVNMYLQLVLHSHKLQTFMNCVIKKH